MTVDGNDDDSRPRRLPADTTNLPAELDSPLPAERPSTVERATPPAKDQPPCDPTATPHRPPPGEHTAHRAPTPGAPADRGAARDAPIRLLPPDYVPLDPENRAQAVRALTELILSWMRRTGRTPLEPDLDSGLDEAA